MQNLEQIIEDHQFTDLAEQLQQLQRENNQLYIGVLGEFSAGKSTLVNAMLGRKLLPTLDKPTTARITEIHPKKNITQLECFLRNAEDELQPISVLDIDEAMMTAGNEVAVIHAPANPLLHEGWCIVDTPGLQSLDETHTDITYGYLPWLDGALICIDINHGGLRKSLQDFLQKPELRPILSRLAFVLTRSDTKPPAEADSIRKQFIGDLERCFASTGNIGMHDLEKRVLLLSPKNMLEGKDDLSQLEALIQNDFIAQRQQALANRQQRQRQQIAEAAIMRLEKIQQTLKLAPSEYITQRDKIRTERSALKAEHERLLRIIDSLKGDIYSIVQKELNNSKPALLESSPERLSICLATTTQRIQAKTQDLLHQRLQQDTVFQIDLAIGDLAASLQNLSKVVDIGKILATAALTAVVLPTASVSTVASTVNGITKLSASAGSSEASEEINIAGNLQEAAIGGTLALASKGSRLGEIIQMINPAEHAGNWLHGWFKERKIDKQIETWSKQISDDLLSQLRTFLAEAIFEPHDQACEAADRQIEQLRQQEKVDAAQMAERICAIQQQIQQLKPELAYGH